MSQVAEHIAQRAEVTPTVTAVRHSGSAVSFSDLNRSIVDYSMVTRAHGMSTEAAVVAGLMHRLPGVTRLPGAEAGSAMANIMAWLTRDLDGGAHGHLRAVG